MTSLRASRDIDIPRIEELRAWMKPEDYKRLVLDNTLLEPEQMDALHREMLSDKFVSTMPIRVISEPGDVSGVPTTFSEHMRKLSYNMVADSKQIALQENGIDVSRDEMRALFNRGYDIVGRVGEGNTREAFRTVHRNGDVTSKRILKRSKPAIDAATSVTTAINASKKDLHLAEILNSRGINHPNVAEVVDSFSVGDRRYNVERDYGGRDLETEVNIRGPITSEHARINIASQLLEGISHMHSLGVLHRDVKPSNVIIADNGRVLVTDLQNAGYARDLGPAMVPTKGGTPYTRAEQLNALLGDYGYVSGKHDDIHALGATLHFMLTGKQAFDYSLKSDEEGKRVKVGDKEFGVRLEYRGKKVEKITEEMTREDLKRIRKEMREAKVPKRWRNLVERCFDDKDRFRDMDEVSKYFDKIRNPAYDKLKSAALKAIPTAMIAAMATGITLMGVYGWKKEPAPKLRDLMTQQQFRDYSLQGVYDNLGQYALAPYVRIMNDSKDKLSKLEQSHWILNEDELRNFVAKHYMDARLGTSVIRAGYVVGNELKYPSKDWKFGDNNDQSTAMDRYAKDHDERVYPGFVPKDFLVANTMPNIPYNYRDDLTMFEDTQRLEASLDYLRLNMGQDNDNDGRRDVVDALVGYFSTNKDVACAKAHAFDIHRGRGMVAPLGESRTISLPYIAWNGGVGYETGGSKKAGYGNYLPSHQKALIDTALSLYMITDDNGHIDWNKVPEVKTEFNMQKYVDKVIIEPAKK